MNYGPMLSLRLRLSLISLSRTSCSAFNIYSQQERTLFWTSNQHIGNKALNHWHDWAPRFILNLCPATPATVKGLTLAHMARLVLTGWGCLQGSAEWCNVPQGAFLAIRGFLHIFWSVEAKPMLCQSRIGENHPPADVDFSGNFVSKWQPKDWKFHDIRMR